MNLSDFYGYIVFGLIGTFLGYIECLKDVRVSVPQAIKRGETAVFMCDFDLEGDLLYTVKWYKGRSEFFRYTPKDEFPIKIFPLDGLNIDTFSTQGADLEMTPFEGKDPTRLIYYVLTPKKDYKLILQEKSKSNMTRLTIEKVQPSLSGKYNCEVSAESSFHTALVSGVMDVVDVPELDPAIEGVKRRYKVGDKLYANCTSGKSNPPANLTWFINGQMASPNQVFQYPDNYSENGAANSKSNIQFVVTTHDFKDGRLLLKCSATIHNIYHRSTEISIDEEGRLINSDSTQIVVVSANFQDEIDENGRKRRRYDSGHESGSPRLLGKTTTSLPATVLCINIFVLILR